MGKGWKTPHKEAKAQAKGKIFTKLAREIYVAAKIGGPDPEGNPRLKMALAAARAQSCPKDTIERAIKKGSGQTDDDTIIEELTYEGFGPHNVGVIVECQTDNRNRTVTDIKTIFKKQGGGLGESGSVMWNFERVSLVAGSCENVADPEEEAIEAGANDVEKNEEGGFNFYGNVEDLDSIRSSLTERGWEITTAELSYRPKNLTENLDDEKLKEIYVFLAALEDNDDTHRVHATV